MDSKIIIALLLVIFTISACAPSVVPTEEVLAPAPTEEPLPTTQPETEPQPELPIPTAWKAVRDQRFGFGLAVPCWWLVSPIPEEGFGGAMTIKNYDEAYFNANSSKGFWEWPNGTLKLDVVVTEGVDPAKSDVDAYMDMTDPTMTGIVSTETQQFGAHTGTVLTVANLVNTNDPDMRLFLFRPSPNILIMIVPVPQTIIDTPDFQALLASFVFTPDEQIVLPTITPAPALIDASCAQ